MVTLEIRILGKNRFKLFTVEEREDLLKLVFTMLIIIGFFLITAK